MNKNDITNIIVNEQFNRMVKQERGNLEIISMPGLPGFEQELPGIDKEQILEIALRMAVMMKISLIARLN